MAPFRARPSWADYPDTSTKVRAQDLEAWDAGLFFLKSQVFYPADFGSLAWNGVSDDQATLTAAIAAAASGGGIVQLPAGTGLIGSPLTLPSNVWLRGYGPATTVLKLNAGANVNMISLASAATDVRVSDIKIDGNRAAQTANGAGITAGSPTRLLVDRVVFDTHGDAILLSGTPAACKVDKVDVIACDGFEGIRADAGTVITASSVSGTCSSALIRVGTGCKVVGSTLTRTAGTASGILANASNITVHGNSVDFSAASGGACINTNYRADAVTVTGNTTTGGACGIQIGGSGAGAGVARTCSYNVVANNIVNGGTSDGILLGIDHTVDTGGDNLVSGNTVRNCNNSSPGSGAMGIGIESQLARTTVTGNTSSGNDDHGIALYGDYSTATGNICRGNNQVTTGAGIKAASNFTTVTGNTCLDNGTASVVADGILIQSEVAAITNIQVTANICTDTRAGAAKTQRYGVRMQAAGGFTPDKGYVYGNVASGNLTGTVLTTGTGSLTGNNN